MLKNLLNMFRKDSLFAETITMDAVPGRVTDLPSANAAAVARYTRFLKRIATHSRNIVACIVNPFHRTGYKEKPNVG